MTDKISEESFEILKLLLPSITQNQPLPRNSEDYPNAFEETLKQRVIRLKRAQAVIEETLREFYREQREGFSSGS